MRSSYGLTVFTVMVCCLVVFPRTEARTVTCTVKTEDYALTTAEGDYVLRAGVHAIGNIVLSVTNSGLFGHVGIGSYDAFTGLTYDYVSEYPKFSAIDHFRSGTFWIGGILDGDTLVSQGFCAMAINNGLYELNPDPIPGGLLLTQTITDPASPGYSEAVSEQDIIAEYTDTVSWFWTGSLSEFDTPHKPLYVKVTQRSYAWSSDMADDFILFDMTIENIGDKTIHDAYFGVVMRPQVGFNITYG